MTYKHVDTGFVWLTCRIATGGRGASSRQGQSGKVRQGGRYGGTYALERGFGCS